MQSGTIHRCMVSCIFILVHLRRMVLLCKWRVILVFYCLVFCCVIWFCLFCLFVFCFYYFFNWSSWKIFWRRLSLVMSFHYCFSLINRDVWNKLVSMLRLCENTVSTLLLHGIQEYTWSVCRNLAGGYLSTDVFWKLWLFFIQ